MAASEPAELHAERWYQGSLMVTFAFRCNIACTFCGLAKKEEAMSTLRKAWENGFRDSDWARRDPDLAILHEEPEFQRMYPAPA